MTTLAQQLQEMAMRRAWQQACREAISRGARFHFIHR